MLELLKKDILSPAVPELLKKKSINDAVKKTNNIKKE